MSHKKVFLVLILFTLFLNKSSLAQETILPGLSDSYVKKLVDTAKANYPKVKSYQNHINIASAGISKTKAGLFNALTFSYVYQPGQTKINPVNPGASYYQGFQAGIFLNVGALISQPYLVRQAKEEFQIAKHDQDEYTINLETEVKKRYYVYLQRMAQLKLQITAMQEAESSFKDMKYRFEKGEETFENLNKSQNDLINHKTTKIDAETNLYLSKADIEELLGTKLENIK
jgi:outer membrane protein TolC